MVRKLLIFLTVVGLAAFGVGSAGANFIDFDSMPLGNIDGLPIGPAFPNGVTITSPDGSTSVIVGDQANFGFVTPPNVLTNNGFLINNVMTFTFDVPRGFVAFVGGDAGGDKDKFEVKLYNSANVNFLTFNTGVFGGNPIDPNNFMVDQVQFSYNGSQFAKWMTVQAFSVDFGPGILIDNLEYCHPAPIPGSLLLLGSGILGLVGIGMRKKS